MVVLDCLLLSENNLMHVQLEFEAPLSFCCNGYIDIDMDIDIDIDIDVDIDRPM
jgi:hypothetical protein